jgi:hypothetical protein
VLGDAMTTAIAPRVGCVVLLAVENETRVDDLDAAQDVLAYSKARRVALVLTTPEGGGGWAA